MGPTPAHLGRSAAPQPSDGLGPGISTKVGSKVSVNGGQILPRNIHSSVVPSFKRSDKMWFGGWANFARVYIPQWLILLKGLIKCGWTGGQILPRNIYTVC